MTAGPESVYFHHSDVRFGDTDRTLRATPMAMYGYLQESAIAHSEAVGLGAAALAAQSRAWVLNRVHVRYEDYPQWRDAVTVETWIAEIAGLYAIREYIMRDSDNRTLCHATSRWVLIDTARARPVRVLDALGNPYGQNDRRAVADHFAKHRPVEHAEVSREFHVRLSDLDPNEHANSACYFDWCIEATPMATHRGCRLASIEITYKAESLLGDGLHAQGQCNRESETEIEYLHTVHNLSQRNVAALGRTRWVKQP